jgi:hypothetical protein
MSVECCQVGPGRRAGNGESCPRSGTRGRSVGLITLKALLLPSSLARLQPGREYRFCPDPECPVTYFAEGSTFLVADLNRSVYQKDRSQDAPVCYCFGYSRSDLRESLDELGRSPVPEIVAEHVRAGRCACEVTNPQGRCCLGNVAAELGEQRPAAPGARPGGAAAVRSAEAS